MVCAQNTGVSTILTRMEIERTLNRYAAQGNTAAVIFGMESRRIRFVLTLPDPEEFRYTKPQSAAGAQPEGPGEFL